MKPVSGFPGLVKNKVFVQKCFSNESIYNNVLFPCCVADKCTALIRRHGAARRKKQMDPRQKRWQEGAIVCDPQHSE
jgi:hypothetical protein